MSFPQLIVLGAIAGYTIFLGLPFARLRNLSDTWRIAAGASSAGVLLFLLIDVAKQMLEPIESAAKDFSQGAGNLVLLSVLALLGLGISYLGLVFLPQWFSQKKARLSVGAEAIVNQSQNKPFQISMLIAIGIGLHNFAEGLAIGQAAISGTIGLAWLLILGFGLHNATEGFGITGPLIGRVLPSWKFLITVGLIGGSPTFLGTLAGAAYSSDVLSVLFLALAAGSIIFVVQTLIHSGLNSGRAGIFSIGLLAGLIIGIATDLVISAAGI